MKGNGRLRSFSILEEGKSSGSSSGGLSRAQAASSIHKVCQRYSNGSKLPLPKPSDCRSTSCVRSHMRWQTLPHKNTAWFAHISGTGWVPQNEVESSIRTSGGSHFCNGRTRLCSPSEIIAAHRSSYLSKHNKAMELDVGSEI